MALRGMGAMETVQVPLLAEPAGRRRQGRERRQGLGFVNQPGHAQRNDPATCWLQARPERAAAGWSCGLASPGGPAGDWMHT